MPAQLEKPPMESSHWWMWSVFCVMRKATLQGIVHIEEVESKKAEKQETTKWTRSAIDVGREDIWPRIVGGVLQTKREDQLGSRK